MTVPFIGASFTACRFQARILLSFFVLLCHVLFAVATANYILISPTGDGNKLITSVLSSSIRKPLARISLCAVLVNIEVVDYFIQTTKYTLKQLNNNDRVFFINLASILITYLVVLVGCILFEAPLREISNLVLAQIIKKILKVYLKLLNLNKFRITYGRVKRPLLRLLNFVLIYREKSLFKSFSLMFHLK